MISTSSLSIPTIKKYAELPPTPSSSYCHSVASKESRFSSLMGRQADRMPSSSSSASRLVVPKKYGSFLSIPLSDDTLSFDEAPPTPPHTTISPNDDDEGLYLLWTHQLLREQGFRPSSCRTNSYKQQQHLDSDNDDDDDESSQSDEDSLHATSAQHYIHGHPLNNDDSPIPHHGSSPYSVTSFISSCFCLSS
ncbi:hypothetical protein BCR42DRAFT_429085 [Absidia repens]|uniref:Uncharacterized protein n=1 Tax=Absidia repens TaxID=90262 RepID=A0A1X2HXH3_9FUNG|nr:hypothetical protein BCR42DRAFT_429085 [Absidia repens]